MGPPAAGGGIAAAVPVAADPTGSRSASRPHGDPVSFELLSHAGRLIGEVLAGFVNFFNPSLILLGGGVSASGDMLLATIREHVYRRSLPLATRELQLTRSPLDDRAGMMGAAHMVIDELFARSTLPLWIDNTPSGQPELAAGCQAGSSVA